MNCVDLLLPKHDHLSLLHGLPYANPFRSQDPKSPRGAFVGGERLDVLIQCLRMRGIENREGPGIRTTHLMSENGQVAKGGPANLSTIELLVQ